MKKIITTALVAILLATSAPAHAGWDISWSPSSAISKISDWISRGKTTNPKRVDNHKVIEGRAWNEGDALRRLSYQMKTVDYSEINGLITPREADSLRAYAGGQYRAATGQVDGAGRDHSVNCTTDAC